MPAKRRWLSLAWIALDFCAYESHKSVCAGSDPWAPLLESYRVPDRVPDPRVHHDHEIAFGKLLTVLVLHSHGVWWAEMVYVTPSRVRGGCCPSMGEGSTRCWKAICQILGWDFFTGHFLTASTFASKCSCVRAQSRLCWTLQIWDRTLG